MADDIEITFEDEPIEILFPDQAVTLKLSQGIPYGVLNVPIIAIRTGDPVPVGYVGLVAWLPAL